MDESYELANMAVTRIFFYNFIVSASNTSFADEVVAIIEVGAIDLVLDTYVALD